MSTETNVVNLETNAVNLDTNAVNLETNVVNIDTNVNNIQKTNHSNSISFFESTQSLESKKTPLHPFEEYDDFKKHPPIPVFNYIINSKTGELIEDKTGEP